MFDEQNQGPEAPKNLPTEPMDMFAEVDKTGGESKAPSAPATPDALSAGLLKKKEGAAAPGQNFPIPQMQEGKMSRPILGKILLFVAVAALAGGLAYAGWRVLYSSKKPTPAPTATTEQTGQTQIPAAAPVDIPAQMSSDQILFGQAIDSDSDGLDDVREREIGTDPQKLDTDGDGLNDGDEVIVYKTNPLAADTDGDELSDGDEVLIWRTDPLNPDTDGDGYLDGEEVRNGYSPLGPGKLFSAPTTPTST